MARHDFDPAKVAPDGRPAARGRLFDAEGPDPLRGALNGEELGGAVTILAFDSETVGAGPRLHIHPYDETFVVIEGRARFFVGDSVIDAAAGEVVLGPAGLPHRFENLGPGRLRTIDIHHSPRWIQTDLE